MSQLFWIGVAGAGGALARYGLQRGAVALLGPAFPWGTLAANGLGCLAFGWLWCRAQVHGMVPEALALPLLAGFLGAFTTFSTFAFETGVLLRQGAWALAAANMLANQLLGLGLFFVGYGLARHP